MSGRSLISKRRRPLSKGFIRKCSTDTTKKRKRVHARGMKLGGMLHQRLKKRDRSKARIHPSQRIGRRGRFSRGGNDLSLCAFPMRSQLQLRKHFLGWAEWKFAPPRAQVSRPLL